MNNNLQIPKGYGVGIDGLGGEKRITHLYKVDEKGKFGNPMCKDGWNRGEYGYSIFRWHISDVGICETCLKRANEGLDGIES